MEGIYRPRNKKIDFDKEFIERLWVVFWVSMFLFFIINFFSYKVVNYTNTEKNILVEVKRFGLPGELEEYRNELKQNKKLVFVFTGKPNINVYDYFLSNGIDLGWEVQEQTEMLRMQKKNTTLVLQQFERDTYKLEMIQKKNGNYFSPIE